MLIDVKEDELAAFFYLVEHGYHGTARAVAMDILNSEPCELEPEAEALMWANENKSDYEDSKIQFVNAIRSRFSLSVHDTKRIVEVVR